MDSALLRDYIKGEIAIDFRSCALNKFSRVKNTALTILEHLTNC